MKVILGFYVFCLASFLTLQIAYYIIILLAYADIVGPEAFANATGPVLILCTLAAVVLIKRELADRRMDCPFCGSRRSAVLYTSNVTREIYCRSCNITANYVQAKRCWIKV